MNNRVWATKCSISHTFSSLCCIPGAVCIKFKSLSPCSRVTGQFSLTLISSYLKRPLQSKSECSLKTPRRLDMKSRIWLSFFLCQKKRKAYIILSLAVHSNIRMHVKYQLVARGLTCNSEAFSLYILIWGHIPLCVLCLWFHIIAGLYATVPGASDCLHSKSSQLQIVHLCKTP